MSSSNQVGVVLVEEEEVELVDPVDANSTLYDTSMLVRRPGRFLKPRATSPEEGGGLPLVQPLLREVLSRGLVKKWPPEVLFRGWSSRTPQWNHWVWKLRPLHEGTWMEAGIHDAVLASTCEFQRDDAAMLGLLECWCPETSTFVLPWPSVGVEATVTLEDVMILGGFPVLGDPVGPAAPPPVGEAGELLGRLVAEHRSLRGRRGLHRVSHAEWMDHCMQAKGGDGPLEHAAFLALWLSRFVFPGSAVQRGVFRIAARLAIGTRVALAPAVLACLYRDLRLMKQRALTEGICDEASPIVVWAPLHILQLWAFERFVSLRPERTPHFLQKDEPRAVRWRCSDAKRRDLSIVRSVLESPNEFRWRPYADDVDNWGRPSYYRHVGRWFTIGAGDDDSLPSLLHCLRAGEIVGLDCVERYAPHRVAMQFGLDQDLPARIPCDGTTWEHNWLAYDEGTEKAKFYVSSQFCKPCATERFLGWQREWMSARMAEVEKIAVEQVEGAWRGQQLNWERRHYSLTTECRRSKPAWKASMAATSAGEQPACMGEGGTWTNKASPTYTEKETENNDDCKPMEIVKPNGDGERDGGNQFNSSFQKTAEDLVAEKCEDAYTEKETQKNGNCKSMEIEKSDGDGEAYSGEQVNSSFQKSAEDLVGEKCEDTCTEKGTQKNGDCQPMEIEKSDSDGEAYGGNQFDSSLQKSTEDLVGEDCEDFDDEQIEQFIIQELEKVEPPCKSTEKSKRILDDALQKQKDLEFDREIQQLKAEIAELEDKLMKLKSDAHVENEQKVILIE